MTNVWWRHIEDPKLCLEGPLDAYTTPINF